LIIILNINLNFKKFNNFVFQKKQEFRGSWSDNIERCSPKSYPLCYCDTTTTNVEMTFLRITTIPDLTLTCKQLLVSDPRSDTRIFRCINGTVGLFSGTISTSSQMTQCRTIFLLTTNHQALFIYNRTKIVGWFPVLSLKNVLPHV